ARRGPALARAPRRSEPPARRLDLSPRPVGEAFRQCGIAEKALARNPGCAGGSGVERDPAAGANRLVQRDQARHADQHRIAPVGAPRVEQPDEARLQSLDEALDQRDVLVLATEAARAPG